MFRSLVTAVLMSFAILPLSAQNLVVNGDFENGMAGWGPWFVDENADWAEPPTAYAEYSITEPGLGGTNKALLVQVFDPGKYDWYILISKEVPLNQNEMYNLSLRAKATKNRSISIGVFKNISSGSPFFTQNIDITTGDRLYGPFSILFPEAPEQPGIKIQFGGMEGDVTVDEVVIEKMSVESDYQPYNSLEDIINDVTLPHEGLPHGVPDSYDWAKGPRRGAQRPPEGWTAAIAWGQLYEWIEGNPATNTRVQIRDMEMYYLSKKDGAWYQLQKSLLVDGAAYVEDFIGDVNKPADKRTEPDGSISVTAGDGYNFHFWPASGRVQFPANEIEGMFVTVQARLILDDPNGIDDRDKARYLMSVGGDWWESLDAVWDNWTTNADMGIGRFRFVTSDWRGYNMISLPVEQVKENPPPFAGSTKVEGSRVKITDFALAQNYPNPFNSSTSIRYQLPRTTHVRMQIFDINGRLIDTLVNSEQPAGTFVIPFSGQELSSGVYFCKLTADHFSDIRRMLLLR